MIEICNLRNKKVEFEYDLRVDRSNKILGNKFYMHSELERDIVCEKFGYDIKNNKVKGGE